ncbi:MAG: type II toxin-antitoxin system RelE/ParE family toxin [Sphingobacteriales bacterium]|jgi:toxin ParE1/3/4|nr:type II toxin-antitoxin system RelE/ParE family toxin [Sphingobacteriales bacterium]HNY54589.1 type II toxin-antitoxin system RelE/ParE family toxin [Chitinophagales bacterium]
MAKVILRQEAINDLSDIWYYTLHKWSEKQADKYYNDIKIACKEIGENPSVGKNYTDISEQLLGFKSGKHILFYHQISADEIEVIRILHESMDLKNRISE